MVNQEDDPRAFELLVKWLYQGKIDNVSDMPLDKKWDYADSCQVSSSAYAMHHCSFFNAMLGHRG